MPRIVTPTALFASFAISFAGSSAVSLLAACGDNVTRQLDAAPTEAGPSRAVVVAGDFQMGDFGVLSTLDPIARTVQMDVGPPGAVGSDPVLRHIGRELLIVNRGENNVTILDDKTLAFKDQLGTGAGSFAQDVAVAGNKLYVPATGTKGVIVLTRGSTATAEIDLSADDPDGKPDCNSIYLVGTRLYVACGLLHDFVASGPGKVYVVDTATDKVVPGLTVTLGHKNPLGWFEQFPAGGPIAGDLVIPTVEDFDTAPGCVERITPGASPKASGCLVDNAMLGGYATRLELEIDTDGQIMWTVTGIPKDFSHGNLRAFDMSLSAVWAGPINPSSQWVTDVAHCPSGQLVMFDSTMNAAGLRVYEGTAEKTAQALPIGKIMAPVLQHGLVCY
jgi:hypothetical protein